MKDTVNRTDNVVVISQGAWSRGATIAKARKLQRLNKTETYIAYIFNHDEWVIVNGDPQWPHDVTAPIRLVFRKGEVVDVCIWKETERGQMYHHVLEEEGPYFDETQKSKYAWMDHEGWKSREEVEKAEAEAKHKLETAMHEELSEDEILENIEQAEIARGALGHGTSQRGWESYRYWTAVAGRRGIDVG
jgi:hypothetical protein